ncbi:MAG: TetR family transcriptional regulator C-terminal domain-containing protein [Bacteroidota bacterium]
MGYKHQAEDIIKRGMELIRTKGYHNVGINEILKASNIPKGSFYNFFSSKEDFAKKAMDSYGSSSLQMIQSFLHNQALSPIQRLRSFYTYLIDANEEEGFIAGCLINTISMEVGGLNPALAEGADINFTSWLEEIAICVKEGQDKGEIRTDYSPKALAEYMHVGTYGGFSRMKMTKNREYLDSWLEMTFTFLGT